MIFTDMDNVIVKSSEAFIQVYSEMFNVKPLHSTTTKWDFSDVFPNEIIPQRTIVDIFSSKRFYELLEPIDDSIEALKRLSEKHKIYIVSICSPSSSKRKIDYCYENFPFANFIPVISYEHDKSIINMSNSSENTYFIDDRPDCLKSSNADYKILFKVDGADWQYGHGIGDFKTDSWINIEKLIKGRE